MEDNINFIKEKIRKMRFLSPLIQRLPLKHK